MDELIEYVVKLKKKEGLLRLAKSRMYWTLNNTANPSVTIMAIDIKTQHVTPEGALEPKLKIDTHDNMSYTFVFQDKRERDLVKDRVANFILEGRNHGQNSSSNNVPGKLLSPPPAGRPGSSGELKRKRPVATAAAVAGLLDVQATPAEIEARRTLLNKNKHLAKLFKDMVVTGTIDEEEFWEMRKSELETATFQASQKSGNLYHSLADIRPVEEDNTTTIKMTSEKIHSIFLQNPALHKAYNDNVPNDVSEKDFWKRYFESKLFYRSRRVVGSVAELGKADPLFDSLRDDIDTSPDPRKLTYDAVNKLIDLSTTAEDHQRSGNTPDVTMVAGKKKEFLPIIRKFNRISEDVLQQTLKDFDPRKKLDRSSKGLDYLYLKETELEELEALKPVRIQPLAIQENMYFDTQSALSHKASHGGPSEQSLSWHDFKNIIHSWTPAFQSDIGPFKTDSVIRSSTEAAKRRKQGYAVEQKPTIAIYAQLIERQTSTLELLRHFWGAFSCPNKADKVEKVAGALRELPKVLVDFLKENSEAPTALKLMESTLQAVEKALQVYGSPNSTS